MTALHPFAPTLDFAFEIRAELAPSLHIGHGAGETTEFTPITGGTVIDITNLGYFHEEDPDSPAQFDGDLKVSEAGVYYRTSPTFRTDAPAYLWLARTVFVGLARGGEDHVAIRMYAVA